MGPVSSDGFRRLQPAPDVLLQALPDGGSVLLELGSEIYFGLDPIGTAVWSAIASQRSLELTVDEVAAQYAVDAERVRSDVAELVGQLIDAGLVEVADE